MNGEEYCKKSRRIAIVSLLLFLVNIAFALFGATLVTIGIYATVDHGTVSEIIGSSIYSSGSYVLVFAGFVIFIIAICACLGIRQKKNKCLLTTYIIILIILFLLIFVGGILTLAFQDSMKAAARSAMTYSLQTAYGRQRLATDAWNYTQTKLRCCGVDDEGWDVYKNSYWDSFTNANEADRNKKIPESSPYYRFVPISCCWTLIDPRTLWPTNEFRSIQQCQHWQFGPPNHKTGGFNEALYYRGCFGAGMEYLYRHAKYIGGVAICVALLLIIGIVASCYILQNNSFLKMPRSEKIGY